MQPILDTKKMYSFHSQDYGLFTQAISCLIDDDAIPDPTNFIFHLTRKSLAVSLLADEALPSLELCVQERMNPLLIDLAGKGREIPIETIDEMRQHYGACVVAKYMALDTCNPGHVRVCRGLMDKEFGDKEYTLTDVLRDHMHPKYDYLLHDGSISFGSGQVINFTMNEEYRVTASEIPFFADWAKCMAQWTARMEDLTCGTVVLDRSADPRLSQLQSDLQ